MKIVDIANEVFLDHGSPSDTSLPAISFWLRGKLGALNTLLYEDFVLNATSLDITKSDGSDIPIEAVAVLKHMYHIYDSEVQIRKHMNALVANPILSVEDQGTTVTRVNRNSVSQTFVQIKKDDLDVLNALVTAYRNRNSPPSQVAGDDVIPAWNNTSNSDYPYYLRG